MLEPALHTPPIYHPCATPWMATCLWMVAMLTMSQVRLVAPLTRTSALSESLRSATWQPSSFFFSRPSPPNSSLTNPSQIRWTLGSHGLEGKFKPTDALGWLNSVIHPHIGLKYLLKGWDPRLSDFLWPVIAAKIILLSLLGAAWESFAVKPLFCFVSHIVGFLHRPKRHSSFKELWRWRICPAMTTLSPLNVIVDHYARPRCVCCRPRAATCQRVHAQWLPFRFISTAPATRHACPVRHLPPLLALLASVCMPVHTDLIKIHGFNVFFGHSEVFWILLSPIIATGYCPTLLE